MLTILKGQISGSKEHGARKDLILCHVGILLSEMKSRFGCEIKRMDGGKRQDTPQIDL